MTFLTQTISVKHNKPLRQKKPAKRGFNEHLKPYIKVVFEHEQFANLRANIAVMQ